MIYLGVVIDGGLKMILAETDSLKVTNILLNMPKDDFYWDKLEHHLKYGNTAAIPPYSEPMEYDESKIGQSINKNSKE